MFEGPSQESVNVTRLLKASRWYNRITLGNMLCVINVVFPIFISFMRKYCSFTDFLKCKTAGF